MRRAPLFVSSTLLLSAALAACDAGTTSPETDAASVSFASTTSGNKSSSAAVKVRGKSVSSVDVSPSADTLSVGESTRLTAIVRDAKGTVATDASVVWTSSDSEIVTVDEMGRVFAKAAGIALIAAASGRKADTATIHSIRPTVSAPAPPSTSGAWFEEDFSRYNSTADLINNSLGVYTTSEDFHPEQITLDQTEGYGDLRQSMKFTYRDRSAVGTTTGKDGYCGSYTIGRNIELPDGGAKEVWLEVYLKWSSNWETDAPTEWGCQSNPDHKLIFGRVKNLNGGTNDAGRFGINAGNGSSSRWLVGYPGNPDEWVGKEAKTAWDGNWHQIRLHMKVSSVPDAADGAMEFWLDGVLVYGFRNIVVNRSEIYGIALGRNMNQGPGHEQSIWWGQVRAWNNNPGW